MKGQRFVFWGLICFFALIYGAWSVNRHNRFQTDAVDLAIFDQPIWHYSRFESPRSTVKYNQYPGEHILGDHFHPTMALFAPLYWVWDDVRIILIAQSLLAVLSVWPIYKIAKMRVGHEVFALALSFSYLSFIGLQTAIDYDFHEITVAILPFSLCVYFLLSGRYWLYAFFALIAVLTKEDMPLVISMLGLFTVLRLSRFRIGATTFILGLIYYFLVTQFAIPYFKHDRFAYEELDPRLGKTTVDLVNSTLSNPLLTASVIFTPLIKTKTLLNLLGSFGFLPLLSPLALLMVLPNLASRFLTRLSQRWLIRFQYSVILTPIFSLAVIFGIEDLLRFEFFRKKARWLIYSASLLLVVFPIIQTIRINGPLLRALNINSYRFEKRFAVNQGLIAKIPRDVNVSVMAQSSFVPHLSHRYKIFRYEDGLIDKEKPDYVLMSSAEGTDPPYLRPDLVSRIDALKRNPNYDVLYWDGERLLMRLKNISS